LFKFFDRDQDQKINQNDLKVVMTEVGLKADDGKIYQMLQDVNVTGQPFSLGEFLQVLAVKLKNTSNPETLKNAFQQFDQEKKGYIPTHEVKKFLMTWGDRLDEKEWGQMMKEMDSSATDLFYYEKFITLLTNTGSN